MNLSLTPGCVIAVLGAESSGKTDLARALAGRLAQQGIAATLVPEYLREWCDREGRVPRPDEQAAIAAEQTRRIAGASRDGVVIADTTAVMTAVYSDMLFDDPSLYADALAAQRGYSATLLTALDLPWVADGLQRDGPHVREPVDALVRGALMRAGVAFSVVHGIGGQRLDNAWNALGFAKPSEPRIAAVFEPEVEAPAEWTWSCDKCSDPVCEHRLFTRLVSQRT